MKFNKRLLNVVSISVKNAVKGGKTDIELTLELPDTAWEVKKPKMLIDNDHREVQITVIGEKKPNSFGLQVITKRTIVLSVSFPFSGRWLIRCNDLQKIIEVKDSGLP